MENKENIPVLKEALRDMDYDAAVAHLTEYIAAHPESDEAYTLRGMRYWGAGKRALAINDFLKAVEINPQSRAKEAIKAADEILDYRNKDLYNP